MILTVNIGNTNINFGLFDNNILVSHYRITVNKFRDDKSVIENWWNGIAVDKIDDIVSVSVNTDTESLLFYWIQRKFGKSPIRVGIDIQPKIRINVKNPEKVGLDRIVNAISAYHLVKKEVVVVDLGTAITFDVVTNSGEFIGGVISPGINMCAYALHMKTGQLPLIKVEKPVMVLGKDTEAAMKSGIYWGTIGTIITVLEKLSDELRSNPEVVATGGDAKLVAEHVKYFTNVIPYLTLHGIRIVYENS